MTDHADWFERNMASAGTPVTLTEGQRRCLNTLQAVTAPSGLYNLWGPGSPTDVITLHSDTFVSALMCRELATFDGSELTRLVIAGHRNCVRVAVTTWHPHMDERRARTVAQHITDVREDSEVIDWEDPQVGLGVYRLNLTARDPESTSLYDRHPDIKKLAELAMGGPTA